MSACAGAPPFAPAPATLAVRHAQLLAVESRDSSPQGVDIALHAVRRRIVGPSLDAAAATITAQQGAPFRGATGQPAGTAWLVGDDFHSR